MAETTYCYIWNAKQRKPIDVIDVDEARARDAAARSGDTNVDYYTVVFGDPHLPDAFIEVVWENDYLALWFLDHEGRRLSEFGFRKVSDGLMFHTSCARWQYPAGAKADFTDSEVFESCSYKQDGTSRRRLKDKRSETTTVEDSSDVDVSHHWVDLPAFDDLTYDWIPQRVHDTPKTIAAPTAGDTDG